MTLFLALALVAALVTFGGSVLVWKLSRKYRLYPKIRDRDVHTRPTPRLGGIAMFVGILAAIGGFHLFPASDLHLDWTAAKLKAIGLVNFIGAHCTGIEATYRIRERVGLDRRHAVVGAVGTGFRLGEGILPGTIAR